MFSYHLIGLLPFVLRFCSVNVNVVIFVYIIIIAFKLGRFHRIRTDVL